MQNFLEQVEDMERELQVQREERTRMRMLVNRWLDEQTATQNRRAAKDSKYLFLAKTVIKINTQETFINLFFLKALSKTNTQEILINLFVFLKAHFHSLLLLPLRTQTNSYRASENDARCRS